MGRKILPLRIRSKLREIIGKLVCSIVPPRESDNKKLLWEFFVFKEREQCKNKFFLNQIPRSPKNNHHKRRHHIEDYSRKRVLLREVKKKQSVKNSMYSFVIPAKAGIYRDKGTLF